MESAMDHATKWTRCQNNGDKGSERKTSQIIDTMETGPFDRKLWVSRAQKWKVDRRKTQRFCVGYELHLLIKRLQTSRLEKDGTSFVRFDWLRSPKLTQTHSSLSHFLAYSHCTMTNEVKYESQHSEHLSAGPRCGKTIDLGFVHAPRPRWTKNKQTIEQSGVES